MKSFNRNRIATGSAFVMCLVLLLSGCKQPAERTADEWIQLFNRKDLSGWTPKFSGYEAGVNFNNTFRVEDSVLKVSYSEYDSFRGEFGHLFYNDEFSSYRLRIEYRFVDEQVPGGPQWAIMNSGVMVHSQSAESMELHQDFPVSLEAQFLSGTPEWKRSTGNLCTPGTHVYLADTLTTQHCIDAPSKTYMLGEWVTVEVIAYRDSILHHVVEGDTVLTYTKPIIGGGYVPDSYSIPEGTPVTGGYLALQSESHPIEFRKVELMVLGRKK
jgi:hypothetical protein